MKGYRPIFLIKKLARMISTYGNGRQMTEDLLYPPSEKSMDFYPNGSDFYQKLPCFISPPNGNKKRQFLR
ncbi:hypothetical protein OUZ56_012046 [Daphnia magna]|uniref:Uncharacterized protein n=1 Tax=Daphnia magna TaxID=35525 RepID=A0ABQ9Z1W1_9CRUS|nr:hypothetical protein OUZ56_012046 [Daphnia magna]